MNKDSVKNLAILSMDSYNVGSGQEQKETQMNLSIINQSNIDVIEKEINNYNGFQAKAYKNNDTGDIVISYAGTSLSSLNDLATDACIASGVRPSQVDDAISFYKRVKEEFCKDDPNIKITLTGHSLGGMLAIQVALDAYNKQLNDMGGVTKENFQNMKAQGKSLEVVAFEAPAIIMPSEYNNQIYDEYKDVLGLFGYKRSYTEDVPGLIYTLVYQPTDDSLDIHELGITSFQNANSVLTRASGLQVGVINLIDAPISHQHFIDDIIDDLNNGIPILYDYQNNYVGTNYITAEVLDKWMKDFTAHVYKQGMGDPLILDLNKDGVRRTFFPNSKSYFNLNNYERYSPNVEWIIANDDDGFLCIDKNHNGRIDNGRELFTEGQPLSTGQLSKNGVDVLKDMDTNHDNVVDKNDEGFENLLFWSDRNGNGISEKEELHTMQDMGIKSFDIRPNWSNYVEGILANGKTFSGKDYFFVDNKADTIPLVDDKTPLNFDNLGGVPYIPRIGFVGDLWTTGSKNSKLRDLFSEYHATSCNNQDQILANILYEWAGTTNISNEGEKKAKTAYTFGTLDELNMRYSASVNSRIDLLKDMIRTMDFMQTNLGEKVIDAYRKDIADSKSKTYANVKQTIIDVSKNSAHDATMATEAFYSMINKTWLASAGSLSKTRKDDFFSFKASTIFMGDDNFKTSETTNRTNVKNIYFDKTVNLSELDFRQVSGTYNFEVTNRANGQAFVLNNFGRYEDSREMTFHLQDAVLDKAALQSRYVCKPASPTDNSRLLTESYSKIPQTIIGDERDNDILAAYNTTVIWGKGDGNDTIFVLAGGDKTKGVHIHLRGLNQDDIFFRREKDRWNTSTSDLYIVQKDSGEKLKLHQFFDTKYFPPPTDLIFEDGTKMQFSDLLSQKDSIPVVDKTALSANLSVYKNNTVFVDPVSFDIKSTPTTVQENKINAITPSLNKKPVYAQTCNPYNNFGHIDIMSV